MKKYYVTMFYQNDFPSGNFISFFISYPEIIETNFKEFLDVCKKETFNKIIGCQSATLISWSEIK